MTVTALLLSRNYLIARFRHLRLERAFSVLANFLQAMGYKIFLSECNRYNIVEVYEPMTHKLAIEQLKALNALIAETGVTNALIDVRNSRFIEPTGVLYLFAYETLAEYNMSKTSKCAVLTAPDDTSHNFLEVAATNAGYNLRIFKDYDEAVNWLNS